MHQKRGFTIIELMVVVFIVGVITVFALPAMRDFIRRSNAASLSNQLLTALSLARSEALQRGRRVSVCASSTGTSCTNDGFDKGYIIFVDTGAARVVNPPADAILQVFEKPSGEPVFNKDIVAVSYSSSGLRESTADGAPAGNCYEFVVSGVESSRSYVHVSVTGSVRTGKGVCAA